MSVPEAAMHKNNAFIFRQDDIRVSRDLAAVKAVSKSFRKQKLPNQQFWFCVFAPYTRHIIASCLFAEVVRQAILGLKIKKYKVNLINILLESLYP